MFFRDIADGVRCNDPGIGDENVEPSLLVSNRREEVTEAVDVGNIAVDRPRTRPKLLRGGFKFLSAATRDVDTRAFLDKAFRDRETDAARSACDDGDLGFQPAHVFLA